jgi:hypothetical protein
VTQHTDALQVAVSVCLSPSAGSDTVWHHSSVAWLTVFQLLLARACTSPNSTIFCNLVLALAAQFPLVLSFADPDGGRADLLRTWVNKTSSRIWRGSYAHGDWQFLGKGAWKPRQKPKRSARGSGRRGNTGNGAAAGGGGGSQRRGGGRATRSDGGAGGSQQRTRARSVRRGEVLYGGCSVICGCCSHAVHT